MAWTYTEGVAICNSPFLIHKIASVVPDSTTATALTHNGPTKAPDFVVVEATHANPTATEITVTATSATTVTVDVEGTAARFNLYCFWLPQARQDGQSISQDNNT